MKKKALRKDFFVEIKKTFNRFISIFFIVALGVAFFVGIRSTEPDMNLSGDKYFDESNLMDIRVLSTLGLTDEDVTSLKNVAGIKEAIGAYSSDLLCITEDKEVVVKVMSYASTINKVTIVDGREPQNDTECVVDTAFLQSSGYKIGDTIHLASGTDDDIKNTLNNQDYTIVGSVTTPYYLDMDRGTTQIGNGTVDSFIMVPNTAFSLSAYTEIFLTLTDSKELISYSKEYDDLLENTVDQIKDTVMDVRLETRYNEVISEANEKLADAKKEYSSGKKEAQDELAKAKKKLTKAKKTLTNAKQEIIDNEAKLEDANKVIEESELKLEDGKNQIESGKLTLASKKKELEAGKTQYNKGLDTYLASKKQYDSSIVKLEEAKKIINEKESELNTGENQLAAAKKELESSETDLEKAKADYETQLELAKQQVESGQLDQSVVDSMIATATAKFSQAQTQISTAKKSIQTNEETLVNARNTLESSKTELNKNEKKLNEAKLELSKAKKQLDSSYATITAGESELNKAEATLINSENEIQKSEARLNDGKIELEKGRKKLEDGKRKLEDGEKEYQDGLDKYNKAKKEADEKLADAKEEIEKGEKEINKIKRPEWYVLDRNTLQAYVEYGQDAQRIGAIGKVFPAIFFLVAALVSLTTMTRMVEEKRTEIGTLKALGYGKSSIIMKYLLYALLATIGGSIFGAVIGSFVFPRIIINAYKIMYTNLPYVIAKIDPYYFIIATLIAVGCVVLATLFACYKELISSPSTLMRPVAPKQGKKVLLERIPFLWKKLNFSQKATVRNLVRYKKRFFMTVFGIGGCMALLLVGFGLKDSIFSIVALQFNEIHLYDDIVTLDDEASNEDLSLIEDTLSNDKRVTDFTYIFESATDVSNSKNEKSAYLTVFKDANKMNDYVVFRDRTTKETKKLDDSGVIITEKLAKLLDLKEGDTFFIKDGDTIQHEVKITGIVENYIQHYVYMSEKLYESLYEETPSYNEILLTGTHRDNKIDNELGSDLLKLDGITNVSYISDLSENYGKMLGSLDIVILVLIISAGGLAFVVLYNLNNININERRRELATIKVLGFYDLEVSEYVYRENIVLTFIGAGVGAILGIVLHRFVILTAEVDMIMFGRLIFLKSYIYSVLLTFLFSILINVFMHFKLKEVDMVESLKSVE
jgi:putative ABC transport system permease protein